MVLLLLVALVVPTQPILLLLSETSNLAWRVGQDESEYDGKAYRHNTFDEKEPAPACQTIASIEFEDSDGEERAKCIPKLTPRVQNGRPKRDLLAAVFENRAKISLHVVYGKAQHARTEHG